MTRARRFESLPRWVIWFLASLALMSLIAVVMLLVYFVPVWYWSGTKLTSIERVEAVNGARGPVGVTLAALLAFASAGAGVAMSRRTVAQSQASLEQAERLHRESLDQQRKAHQEVLRLQQNGANDGQFAKCIEWLGNSEPSMRMGAIYALRGLTSRDPARVQPALDIACAYLRKPFEGHPKGTSRRDGPHSPGSSDSRRPGPGPGAGADAELERQVRLAAQSFVIEMLGSSTGEMLTIDLSGARLDEFTVRNGRFSIKAASAAFTGGLRLIECEIGSIDIPGSELTSVHILQNSKVHGGIDMRRVKCAGPVQVLESSVSGDFDLRASDDLRKLSIERSTFLGGVKFPYHVSSLRLVDSRFERAIDLTSSHLVGHVDLQKSEFKSGIDLRGDALAAHGGSKINVTGSSIDADHPSLLELPPGWSRWTSLDGERFLRRDSNRRA